MTTPPPTGRVPTLDAILRWLGDMKQQVPEAFDAPSQLIDRAVSDGLIESSARDALAQKILELRSQGMLTGYVRLSEDFGPEQRLGHATDLDLSMRAYEVLSAAQPPGRSTQMVFNAPVSGQVAGGNITNYVSFTQLLERAESELEHLQGVDDQAREDARSLVQAMLGKTRVGAGQVVTGAGGSLLAGVLAQLVGLPQ